MDDYSRREFLKTATLAAVATQIPTARAAAHATPANPAAGASTGREVELHWLEETANPELHAVGCTWGVPWPRGGYSARQTFSLRDDAGDNVPVQSWPIAYWPDGSLKWTAHAVAPGRRSKGKFVLRAAEPPALPAGIVVRESGDSVEIDTGAVLYTMARTGRFLLRSASRDGKSICRNLRLVCQRQDRSEQTRGIVREEPFAGTIESVTIEQRGPLRAIVKVDGRHRSEADGNGRAWLPFCLRFYFYQGSDALRLVHSFVYDGQMDADFIAGLGVRFDVPLHDPLHDRHVRFVGEQGGLWGEGVRNLSGLRREAGPAITAKQIAGLPCPPVDEFPPALQEHLADVPSWNDYTLLQPAADAFEIHKRTGDWGCWLTAGHGHRAPGAGYVGGTSGGVAFGLRDFWQRYPTQLDIRNATTAEAEVTVWLWAHDAPAMDMRHYDRTGHNLDITYEDWQEGMDIPMGVARTSELMLWMAPATPSREALVAFAQTVQSPPLLVCQPAYYQSLGLFGGMWTLPDRSTPVRREIEDRLDSLIEFYQTEIEQRHWYGFWHYGDVMHTYDRDRHVWRYDVGGYAWDNSELSPDLWLWYSFLRTGCADIFRQAEALTRHTGEVDVHHLGPFAGLGSRHAVVHWGDSAKQVRVSQSTYRRIFYYLTADERVGDLMRQVVDSDQRLVDIDPVRKLLPKSQYPTHAGAGPDWFAFAANWLTEWERTGDNQWRDKIVTGMKCLAAMPHGIFSGPMFGYDPATGKLYNLNDDRRQASHLSAVFGGAEICVELASLIDEPDWDRTWLEYCELYNTGVARHLQQLAIDAGRPGLPVAHSRLTAYAAWRKHDQALARRAAGEFFAPGRQRGEQPRSLQRVRVTGPVTLNPIDEIPWISTNDAAQWSLAAIQNLALIGEALDEHGT